MPNQTLPNAQWYDWLMDPSSLTRRLQQASNGHFQVELLNQAIVKPALNEAALLGLHSQAYALVRQVCLRGHDQPWVFARTVIPLSTLAAGNRYLLKLGNRSLGSVLFRHAHTHRAPIEITYDRRRQEGFQATSIGATLPHFWWGRRSVFQIKHAPLLVSEFFLDDFQRSLALPTETPLASNHSPSLFVAQ
ncbi:chorismate lyase [Oceanospirillum multiglobuliferum]|uniref:Probable chorismate pyruvate-lyase n=1 Tax=Oceanospirillum multiglobuliferum TaxID=64969 RepID=A0A1T4NV08_9GAMM|nr:chorismate lyase [Oceanospirillum multiglobuliferum]OPX55659.1 hypothetical protein BTE48_07105 [Oceanospirillum multiglobuliferum]SJZ82876.1 chorismate lyase [Oceanospirillum multiglobuliferum]